MKKILSLLLALAMIATLAPVAMAEDNAVEHSIEAYRAVGNKTLIKGNTSKYSAWYLTPTEATCPANQMSTIMTSKKFGVQPLPLPDAPNGKLIGRYIFQFGSVDTYGTSIKVLKLPGENWDLANMTSADPAFADLLANPNNHNAGDSAILYESSPYSGTYRNFVDLTSYAQECVNNGQKVMYVVFGCWNSTRNMRINITWTSSGYPTADLYQAYYYDFIDADPLEMQSATIENGMKGLTTEKEISFVFNNRVESATITLNGEIAETSVSGVTVKLETKLETFKNYTLALDVTDVYGTSQTYTYELVTGGGYSSSKFSDGYTYHITASADPVAMTSKKNIDGRSSHAAVYRIPLPQITQGEALDTFVVTIFPFSQNASGAYKLPGDDWELTSDLNEDGAMLRYSDLYPAYLNSDNAVCTAEEKTTTNMTPELTSNIVFRHTYDMTRYANECIVRGEQYLDFAVYAPGSTMDVWGFATENWYSEYKATYEYTTYPTEGSREYTVAKFAPADSEATYDEIADATAISKSAAYKAVAKVSNATAHDFDVVIAIADYEDDTLVSVKLTTVTVPARTRDFDVVSAAIDVSAVSDEAKAFVWSESDNYPFALHSAVSIS